MISKKLERRATSSEDSLTIAKMVLQTCSAYLFRFLRTPLASDEKSDSDFNQFKPRRGHFPQRRDTTTKIIAKNLLDKTIKSGMTVNLIDESKTRTTDD